MPAQRSRAARRRTESNRRNPTSQRVGSPTPQRLSFANFGRVTPNRNNSPATPNRNKSPATPNRNKSPVKKMNLKFVNALKTKTTSAALAAAGVPNKLKGVFMRAAPKIKGLLSDNANAILWTILILMTRYIYLLNPRLSNNTINLVIKGSMRNQFPQRFIGGKPPIPEPEPALTKAIKFIREYYANMRASSRARNAGIEIGEELFNGFLDTMLATNLTNKYGKSKAGIIVDYVAFVVGVFMVILAYFPYLKPGARKLLNQMFHVLKKMDIDGKFQKYVGKRITLQKFREMNKQNFYPHLAGAIFEEGVRYAAAGGRMDVYALNFARRSLPSSRN